MVNSDRIANAFDPSRLASAGKSAAFVSYACAGDPDFETSVEVFRRLVKAGVDVLEIGVPFSDPLADGPTNQRAAERALASGMHSEDVFRLVRRVREFTDEAPIVFYTYYNLVYSKGIREYVREAVDAGVDGLLVLDLPPEEAGEYLEICKEEGMSTVFIVAPTTPPERIPIITGVATGFVYYVSREGVTGERSELAEGVKEAVAAIQATTDYPVVVGFGISTHDHVRATAGMASGVVVGSAIVKRCAALANATEAEWDEFSRFLLELTSGCNKDPIGPS
ncbi:MAG: tryptophan synthase subunit alpha [Verrucomicrobiota bacterium]